MITIIGNIQIAFETELIAYELSVGIDFKKNKYYMPCLSFIKDYGMMHEKHVEDWDNETFLYETLYNNVLLPWIIEQKIPCPEHFAELLKIDGVRLEDFQGLYDLFNKAIEMKFFDK